MWKDSTDGARIIGLMPSIEIVCIDQDRPKLFGDLPFAVVSETALISHRHPSLFQVDFDQLKGCIYHLGNPALKDPEAASMYFAWDLLSLDCQRQEEEIYLEFAGQYTGPVRQMMEELLLSSPVRRVIFTSDHQFGPPVAARFGEISLTDFWRMHDSKELRMNALYPVVGS